MWPKIKWISSIDKSNESSLRDLENKMHKFYTKELSNYYDEIDFTKIVWESELFLSQQCIIKSASQANRILEVGCGSSNILFKNDNIERKYFGCDFSEDLMSKNQKKYPFATFKTISNPNELPFPSESFDLVFSHFVIEHSVRPHYFLNECSRVLKSGGFLIILCPAFLSNNGISSQRVGFSQGTGREKLSKRKILDALVTLYDNKVRLPNKAKTLRQLADKTPHFFINTQPTCFTDSFRPDVDAVYLTYEPEIKHYLSQQIAWVDNDQNLSEYCNLNRQIFLKGQKKG